MRRVIVLLTLECCCAGCLRGRSQETDTATGATFHKPLTGSIGQKRHSESGWGWGWAAGTGRRGPGLGCRLRVGLSCLQVWAIPAGLCVLPCPPLTWPAQEQAGSAQPASAAHPCTRSPFWCLTDWLVPTPSSSLARALYLLQRRGRLMTAVGEEWRESGRGGLRAGGPPSLPPLSPPPVLVARGRCLPQLWLGRWSWLAPDSNAPRRRGNDGGYMDSAIQGVARPASSARASAESGRRLFQAQFNRDRRCCRRCRLRRQARYWLSGKLPTSLAPPECLPSPTEAATAAIAAASASPSSREMRQCAERGAARQSREGESGGSQTERREGDGGKD